MKNNTKVSSAANFFRRMFSRKISWVGAIGTGFFVLMALFAPLIATQDPAEMDMMNTLAGISAQHLLGTDMYGRDLFSRIVYGSRVSLVIGVLAVSMAVVVGAFLGMLAAYCGGIVDTILMRLCDAFCAIPQVAISMALIAIYGGSVMSMAVILSITAVPQFIRMMRASSLSTISSDYVLAARLSGASMFRQMLRHIFPNSVSPIIILATQQIGSTILMEAGLSFLGVGIQVPTASWGSMVNEARPYLITHPLYVLGPCVCIALLVISLNVFGDGIRDALDPSLRGEK